MQVKKEGGTVVPGPPAPSPEAVKAKKSSLQSITDVRRASAWQVHRWPFDKHVTWERAKIYLPRSYLARDGVDIRVVHQGSDLNQLVYQHYLEQVDLKTNTWVNFVHTDNVVAQRYVEFDDLSHQISLSQVHLPDMSS